MKRTGIPGFDRFRLATCGVALAVAGGGLVACSNRDINSSAAGGHSGAGGQSETAGTGGTAGTGVGGDSSVSHGGISGTGGINGTGGASGTGGIPGTPMRASYATGIAPSALALGDFNSDGKLDIAVAYRGDLTHAGGVSVLLNLGQGVYAAGTTYATQAPATSIATAHFNGDVRPDLVIADSAVTVLLNVGDGTGRFGTPVDYAAAAAASIAVADLDGDGRVDVAVGGGAIAVLLGGEGGVLGSPIPVGAQTGSTVAIGDLDDDGKPDLITAGVVGGVIVMRNTGGATFAAPQTYPVFFPLGYAAVSVAAGDLTGDGKADIIDSWTGKDTGPGQAFVLLTDPSGVPGTPVGYGTGAPNKPFGAGPRGTGPDMAAIGDIDGDGKNDLVAANSGGALTGGNIGLSLNHGDGTFAQPKVFLAGTNPVAVAIGDVDGDGQNDIVVANAGSNDVTVLRAPF
jgi:hypothetical protein